MTVPLIIAIDGPAGAGKSTLARRIADHYGLFYLDTGLLYRAVARCLMDAGEDCANEAAAVAAAGDLSPQALDPDRLYGEGVGAGASQVAALPALREALLPVQRRLAGQVQGSVVVGRDIGSVVLPDCPVKFFITASLEERGRRRYEDLHRRGETPIISEVLAELEERDRRDSERAVAPLVVPDDAIVIDTTAMDAGKVFEAMRSVVDRRRSAA